MWLNKADNCFYKISKTMRYSICLTCTRILQLKCRDLKHVLRFPQSAKCLCFTIVIIIHTVTCIYTQKERGIKTKLIINQSKHECIAKYCWVCYRDFPAVVVNVRRAFHVKQWTKCMLIGHTGVLRPKVFLTVKTGWSCSVTWGAIIYHQYLTGGVIPLPSTWLLRGDCVSLTWGSSEVLYNVDLPCLCGVYAYRTVSDPC